MRLKKIRPFSKFACIKLVVFFTWWQDVTIAALVQWDIIDATKLENPDLEGFMSTEEVAVELNSLIICIEMLIFSIVHVYSFPPRDYAVEDMSGVATYSLWNSNISDSLLDRSLHDPEANPWSVVSTPPLSSLLPSPVHPCIGSAGRSASTVWSDEEQATRCGI